MIETNKELHLKNVISVRRKMTQIELGIEAGLQSVYNELNAYIAIHKLQPVTPAFSVSLNPFANTQEKVNIDIYVGINPNIL